VELPSSAKGVRYRVIVENSEGEESLPSISLMVRTGKWRDSDSSSLLSKLEKKYMPVADPGRFLYHIQYYRYILMIIVFMLLEANRNSKTCKFVFGLNFFLNMQGIKICT